MQDKTRDGSKYDESIHKHLQIDKDRIGETKTNVVVAVIGIIVGTDSYPAILLIIVPTTPAKHTVLA